MNCGFSLYYFYRIHNDVKPLSFRIILFTLLFYSRVQDIILAFVFSVFYFPYVNGFKKISLPSLNSDSSRILTLAKIGGKNILDQFRMRSVPSPREDLGSMCQGGTIKTPATHCIVTWSDPVSRLTGQVGAIALLQRSSGARIGEILQAHGIDIVLPDLLIIHGSKKSRDRSIRVPELTQQFILPAGFPGCLLFSVSYSQVYRAYLNAGIVCLYPKNRNRSVTHNYRVQFIKRVHGKSKRLTTTAEIVGHKSISSTQSYINKR